MFRVAHARIMAGLAITLQELAYLECNTSRPKPISLTIYPLFSLIIVCVYTRACVLVGECTYCRLMSDNDFCNLQSTVHWSDANAFLV